MNSFFTDNTDFLQWGTEHLLILVATVLSGILFIHYGKHRWSISHRRKYILWLCGLMIFFQLLKPMIKIITGQYSSANDLPLHLCNLMPFALLFIFRTQSRDWWAIFFFWIIGGSSQALFTTVVKESLPHYESIRYWLIHGGIVIAALYGYFAYEWRLVYSDVLKSCFAMNVAALIIYPLNLFLHANYFYLNYKPAGTNLYSLLPAWPTYILCLEGVLLLVFSFVYLFFKVLAFIPIKTSNHAYRNQ